VSASAGVLSCRYRFTRAKRSATPPGYCGLSCTSLNAISTTSAGRTYTVYVRPEIVVEIAFNEIQASAQYPGGVALRFARVKSYRPDKAATEADTIHTVRAIYQTLTGV